jgi:DNA-binding SARP family transcriptional activator/tetratricopeptide (TPR) repeat protein
MSAAFVRLLGAVRFVDERGEAVDLPSAAQRQLLAALALANGATVRSEYLCEALDLTSGSLRTTVSRVRSRIGDGVIRTDSAGYRITCAVDTTMFTDLLVERPERADRLVALDEALALWRGEALDEFRHEPWAAPEVARLDELRAHAIEDRAELLIVRGRPEEAVAALEPHVAAHPLRDRPRGLLIQGLASSGRQADALRTFQAYRTFLAEETGTEPSALVRSIERRVAAGWDDAAAPDRDVPQRLDPRRSARVVEVPLPGELAEAPELIGRRRELTWLDSELVAARSGALRIALIGGEPGIGKTTMLAAFARAHLEAGNVVAFGRCAQGEAVPLEPFGGIVADLVEHAPLDLLQEHSERCGGELQRIAPRLGNRLWVPPPVTSDAASERHQLFEAITDLLRRVAWAGSLTLILDDLHWAEPSALHLLRHLSRSLVDAPVLLVGSYRDTLSDSTPELRTALADLDRGRCRSISLGGFDDAELTRLAQAVVGSGAQPATNVVAHLRGETSGNPLFALQFVRHLWETKQLTIADGQISFAGGELGEHLPRGLLDVVWSRVHALGEPTTEVLNAASVLGVEFAEDVLLQMTGLVESDVDASLDSAIGAGLLIGTGDVRRSLRFVHALVAHGLYSEMPPRQRRRLHGRAAQVLQRGGGAPSADVVIELARHSFLSGDLTAAQRWAVAAGDHAYANLAPAEAARWYERALTYAAERHVDEAERAELETRLGEAQHRAGDPRARETLLGAATAARKVGARDALVRAALANDRGFSSPRVPDVEQIRVLDAAIDAADPTDVSTMARLLALRAQELVHTGEHELRLASARQAIELLDRSDEPRLLPQMLTALAFGLWGPATLGLRRDLAARAAAAVDGIDDPILEFTTRRATFYVGVESADVVLATTSLERVKAIAAEIAEPRLLWVCAALEAFEAMMEARLDDAERLSSRMLEIGTEIGEPDAFALYAAQLFVNRSFAGRYAEVIPLLEAALETTPDAMAYRAAHAISCSVSGREHDALAFLLDGLRSGFEAVPTDWTWITTVIGYAVVAIELEHREAAAALHPIIEPYADQVAFTGGTSQGYIGAYVGKLASLLGDHDGADTHLRRALEVHRQLGWRYHEATTLVALAISQRRRTGAVDARGQAWLDDARSIADERGLGIVAKQVEQLRRSIGGDARV